MGAFWDLYRKVKNGFINHTLKANQDWIIIYSGKCIYFFLFAFAVCYIW